MSRIDIARNGSIASLNGHRFARRHASGRDAVRLTFALIVLVAVLVIGCVSALLVNSRSNVLRTCVGPVPPMENRCHELEGR
jgi:hypothetical protein